MQNVLTALKVARAPRPHRGMARSSRARGRRRSEPSENLSSPSLLVLVSAFVLALVGPAFSQSAWTNVTFPGGEVKEPGRTFPLALLAGCALVASLYVLTNVGYLRILGVEGVAHAPEGRVGTAAAERLLPGAGGTAMAAAILVSTFGCANGLVLSGARVVWALARGRLPARGSREPERRGRAGRRARPAGRVGGRASSSRGRTRSFCATSSPWSSSSSSFSSRRCPSCGAGGPTRARPYRAWGHPVTTGLFLAAAGCVVAVLAVASPRTTWPGLRPRPPRRPRLSPEKEGGVREAGERAWLLEWDGEESAANAKARAAAAALRAAGAPGLLDAVPSARTCLVLGGALFDPAPLAALESDPPAAPAGPTPRAHEIRFAPDGADLDEIASRCGLTPEGFLRAFTGLTFTVGLPRLHARLRVPLRAAARVPSPAPSEPAHRGARGQRRARGPVRRDLSGHDARGLESRRDDAAPALRPAGRPAVPLVSGRHA